MPNSVYLLTRQFHFNRWQKSYCTEHLSNLDFKTSIMMARSHLSVRAYAYIPHPNLCNNVDQLVKYADKSANYKK